jgi:hypothetical protein
MKAIVFDVSEWEGEVLDTMLTELRRAVKRSAKSIQLKIDLSKDTVTFVEAKLDNVALSGVTHWMPGPKPEVVPEPPPVPTLEEALTTEALTAVLKAWCLKNGREHISADELILHEDMDPESIEWLRQFIDRWDTVQKAEAAALAEARLQRHQALMARARQAGFRTDILPSNNVRYRASMWSRGYVVFGADFTVSAQPSDEALDDLEQVIEKAVYTREAERCS